MEFVVDKARLFKELQYVQGVVERKTTVPILANILIEAEEGRLTVTATDLDVTVRCSTEAEVKKPGSTAISARKLFEIVRNLSDDPVHFRSDGSGWVHLECRRSKFKIAGLSKDNYPEIPKVQGDSLTLPAALLRLMVSHTIFAVTQEESRYALNGALMLIKDSSLTLVTTDGHRLALAAKNLEGLEVAEEIRILVPKKTLVELAKMAEEVDSVELARSENHLFFRLGDRLLVSRLLTGQFPNFEMVIPRENDRRAVLDAGEFLGALKRVQVMADEHSRGVRFEFSEGEVRISSASADYGEADETMPAEFQGETVLASFNVNYLLDFLGAVNVDRINFDLKNAETQGLLMPADDDNYTCRYVVMPMKL